MLAGIFITESSLKRHIKIFKYCSLLGNCCHLNRPMSAGEETGPNFRVNDHIQKFWTYHQNNECDIISMAYSNYTHSRNFINCKIMKMLTLLSSKNKMCPGPRRYQKLNLRCGFVMFVIYFFDITETD